MAQQTAEAPSMDVRDAPRGGPVTAASGASRWAAIRAFVVRFRWPLGALALLAISTVIVLEARVRPGYDPYGWLVWGKLSIHWKLETDGAPSWKPLPYLFTLPYALVGHDALWLWMITAVAVALHPHPIVTVDPLHNGWSVIPSHVTTAAQRARCHGLRMTYRS